ncbi:MAG: hypothetical protein KDH96_02915 [Candidatus Riesia sp.]|nr:hypothetical protein [Candidatus Riesia sp.]
MLHRCNVVDNIDPHFIDEQYIDDLPVGITIDYLLGRAVGMFHQHVYVTSNDDDIIFELLENINPKVASRIQFNISALLLDNIHDMYVNIEDGSVFHIEDWMPSEIFLESLSLDYRISYQMATGSCDDVTLVVASIIKSNVRQNIMNNSVTKDFFCASGKTYSEAMCKCLLKYFFDLGN